MGKCFSDLFNSKDSELVQVIEEGAVVTGFVTAIIEYGAYINLGTVDGFIHDKEISWDRGTKSLKYLNIGDKVVAKIIKNNRENNKILLSIRQLTHPWQGVNVAKLHPIGSKQVGTISAIVDYGFFVNLGGSIEGLVHKSEISYDRVPPVISELFYLDQQLEVLVTNIDEDKKRISLSLKQVLEDPWKGVSDRYMPGKIFNGKIVNVIDSGIFVYMEIGITGLISIDDVSLSSGMDVYDEFKPENEITVEVLSVSESERRMALKNV